MVWRRVSFLTAGLLLPFNAAPPAPNEPLQPIRNWNLDYADTQCIAARDYGDAADPITFGVRPAPNGETYELLVRRPGAGPALAEELRGSVDFGQGPIKAWVLHYGVKGAKSSIYQYRISAADMAQARTATSAKLHAEGGDDFSFALRVMPAVLDGLAKCTADLKTYWNMDGEKTGKIAAPPKGDVRVFTDDDYPVEAANRLQEGNSQFLLLIDEKGSVAACHVEMASGIPALDAMGCEVIRQRAKFKPALDRNGKPVRSTAVTPPIHWLFGN